MEADEERDKKGGEEGAGKDGLGSAGALGYEAQEKVREGNEEVLRECGEQFIKDDKGTEVPVPLQRRTKNL